MGAGRARDSLLGSILLITNTMLLSAKNVQALGVMRDLDAKGNLQIETAVQIPPGTRVDVQCDGDFSAMGNAMYCRPLGNAFLIGIRLRRNRRREPRFEVAGSVLLSEIDTRHATSADIRHISLSGIGLTTGWQFQPQTLVRVETSSWFVFGEVRYCTPTDDGRYSVGIIFLTESFEKSV
jgi:hypothetical protein